MVYLKGSLLFFLIVKFWFTFDGGRSSFSGEVVYEG